MYLVNFGFGRRCSFPQAARGFPSQAATLAPQKVVLAARSCGALLGQMVEAIFGRGAGPRALEIDLQLLDTTRPSPAACTAAVRSTSTPARAGTSVA